MPRYYNPSPSFPFLSGLFGQDALYSQGKRAYKLGGPSGGGGGGGLFGPGAATGISDYLNLTGSNAYTQSLGNIGQTGNFQGLPPELRDAYYQATDNLDRFIGESQPIVSSMIQTGMPTDIGSLVAGAQSRYTNQFLPEAAERYNPATGSGFANIAAREANLMGVELGQLDYAAQEAARGRQQWGVSVGAPALSSLASARLALPGATLDELQGMSQTSDPGGRLLAALMGMLGMSEQPSEQVTNTPHAGGTSGTGEVLGYIGSLTGCWVAEELFGAHDARTYHARLWCSLYPDHPFVQQYMHEGQAWAAWLSANSWARPLAEPVWALMAAEGERIARQIN